MSVIILDVETTGLKFDKDDIIQIAWFIYDENEKCIKKRNAYIETDLNITNSQFHGITNELLEEKGIPFYDAMVKLMNDIKQYDIELIVCHNVKFDLEMIKSNCKRKYIDCSHLIQTKTFCTMLKSEKMYGRWLKLSVLYERLFDDIPKGLHNAVNDVRVTAKCYFKMIKPVRYYSNSVVC